MSARDNDGPCYATMLVLQSASECVDYLLNSLLLVAIYTILSRLSTGCYTELLLHCAYFLALGSAVINLIGQLTGPLFHL